MEKIKSVSDGFDLIKKEMEHEKIKSTVLVYDKNGKELDPCSNKRARILIERGHANILKFVPFTIQLIKETGDFLNTEFELHKGTVQVCVSNVGQNRTEFMLTNAINLTKIHKKVLFISNILNEGILNELIKQEVYSEEVEFIEYFNALCLSEINVEMMDGYINQFEPDIVIIDNWKEEFAPNKLAKTRNIAIWYGLSTIKKIDRMPQISDIRFHVSEQDAALIVGLYGNQVAILKNRYGSDLERKAANQKNIKFSLK